MKKILTSVISISFLAQTLAFAYVTGGAITQTPTNIGNVQNAPTTSIDSYPAWSRNVQMITNCDQLQQIAFSEKALQGSYGLANDIDCTDKDFLPIGSGVGSVAFSGKFIGFGHAIRGLAIGNTKVVTFKFTKANGSVIDVQVNELEPKGLFGRLNNAEIVALNIEQASIKDAGKDAGLLAGQAEASVIEKVNVSGDIAWAYLDALQRFDAIDSSMGGLVGINAKGSSINKSSADVLIKGRGKVGGLVGNNSGYIYDSYSKVVPFLSNSGNEFGGLIGHNEVPEKLTTIALVNTYAQIGFDPASNLGGSSVGGLIGHDIKGKATNGYAITNSHVEGFGALVGQADQSQLKGLYWDKEASQNTFAGFGLNGTGNTTKEMITQTTFKEWDFNGRWEICQDPLVVADYPTLTWQRASCAKQVTKKVIASSNSASADQFGRFVSASRDRLLVTKDFNINVYRVDADNAVFSHSFDLVSTTSNEFKPVASGDFFYAIDNLQAMVEIFRLSGNGKYARVDAIDVSNPELSFTPVVAVSDGSMTVVSPKTVKSYGYTSSGFKPVGQGISLDSYWPKNAAANNSVAIKSASMSTNVLALVGQYCDTGKGGGCTNKVIAFTRSTEKSNWVFNKTVVSLSNQPASVIVRQNKVFVISKDKLMTFNLDVNNVISLVNTTVFRGQRLIDISEEGYLATQKEGYLLRWNQGASNAWVMDRKIQFDALSIDTPVAMIGNLMVVGNIIETVNSRDVSAIDVFGVKTNKAATAALTQAKAKKSASKAAKAAKVFKSVGVSEKF